MMEEVIEFIDKVLDDPMTEFDVEQQRNAYIIALGEVKEMISVSGSAQSKESEE